MGQVLGQTWASCPSMQELAPPPAPPQPPAPTPPRTASALFLEALSAAALERIGHPAPTLLDVRLALKAHMATAPPPPAPLALQAPSQASRARARARRVLGGWCPTLGRRCALLRLWDRLHHLVSTMT